MSKRTRTCKHMPQLSTGNFTYYSQVQNLHHASYLWVDDSEGADLPTLVEDTRLPALKELGRLHNTTTWATCCKNPYLHTSEGAILQLWSQESDTARMPMQRHTIGI